VQESPELEAMIRRGLRAVYTDHDPVTAGNLLRQSRDPRSRVILPADDEWAQGPGTDQDGEFIVRRALEIGTTDVEFDLIEAYEHGEVGWAAGIAILHRGTQESIATRFTATYLLEDGSWRNVQWHSSIGVSNADAWGVELSDVLKDLVASLDDTSDALIEASSRSGTVTLLFSDVAGSTRLSESLGDQRWAALIQSHFVSLRTEVEAHGGTVIKTLGDGAMAAFSSVVDGLDAALAIQDAVSDGPFDIRIGLHTGDAIHADGDYVGITVNKAARIASAARPREILVSSVTAEIAAGRGFGLGASRTVELKGLAGTHRLTPIVTPRDASRDAPTPRAGRP
jgi:class 3 adenylate cyclase